MTDTTTVTISLDDPAGSVMAYRKAATVAGSMLRSRLLALMPSHAQELGNLADAYGRAEAARVLAEHFAHGHVVIESQRVAAPRSH